MRIRSVFAFLAVCLLSACSGGGLFKAYEYEEEMYISLDGTATVYVNSSVAALNALRGTSFDTDPAKVARSRRRSRRLLILRTRTSDRVTLSRKSNRRFIHVRLAVDSIDRLAEAPPFAWSTYSFKRDGELFNYRQNVGASAGKDVGNVGWKGNEIVAFRLHLPSKIAYHNAGSGNPQRGNILVWEQSLSDRLRGTPLMLDARMETQSILYRTLTLFGLTFIVVAVLFVLLLWWVLRRGAHPAQV